MPLGAERVFVRGVCPGGGVIPRQAAYNIKRAGKYYLPQPPGLPPLEGQAAQPCPLAMREARGWTGPGLNGKAPFFRGLGALIFISVFLELQRGQTGREFSLHISSNTFWQSAQ